MPIGKKIYEVLSKRSGDRRKKMANKLKTALPPESPAKASIRSKGEIVRSKSSSVQIVNLGPRRKISPKEGRPAVNSSADIDHLIHTPKKIDNIDYSDVSLEKAIKPKGKEDKKSKAKCKKCGMSGHNARSCGQ